MSQLEDRSCYQGSCFPSSPRDLLRRFCEAYLRALTAVLRVMELSPGLEDFFRKNLAVHRLTPLLGPRLRSLHGALEALPTDSVLCREEFSLPLPPA